MNFAPPSAALLAAALVAVTMLSACDGKTAGQTAQPTPPQPTITGQTVAERPTTTPSTAKEVDCGPVDLPAATVNVIAVPARDGGIVGCTEAINVLDEYVKRTPTGPVTIDGWTCDTEARAGSVTTETWCVNAGLVFHTKRGA